MSMDQKHMTRALELARFQHGRTGKNPSVGCVIVDLDGHVISEGATGDGGRPHAEQVALSSLPRGEAAGATAYVTLEPCRQRSTCEASCSTRLIDAGVARVVIAALDPHPQGSGGLQRLREAGIAVEVDVLQDEAEALYEAFFASIA
ncbi:MAG: bifunctional diaminohydroxyphosphoribosylaminopyrimidine deaminase/5-amino-6-(5-phosphoribosylamino)uracil reductase RibD [Pseudomonadota bacterium]